MTLDAALDALRDHAGNERVAARIFDAVLRQAVEPHHNSLFWGDRLLTLDKSAAFRSDPRFADAMKGVSSDTGATQYASPDGISWRLNTLVWAARTALHTSGDFVECGVYKGDMSWVVTELVDLTDAGRTFYLYDTYEGFSPRYSSEDDFPLAPQFFHIAHRGYNSPELYDSVRNRFSGKPYVKVIKGVVPDILREIAPDKISFLHIDMNSPAPEVGALELLFERVSPGGVVILDDYGWFLHTKQKDADDRFMSDHGHEILELPTGQGLLIKHDPRLGCEKPGASRIVAEQTPSDTQPVPATADDQQWKIVLRPLDPLVDEGQLEVQAPITMESIKRLLSSAAYNDIIRPYFSDYPAMSLMYHNCRAFIYGLVRMCKPERVAEIGTYFAGTTEVFARALWENGRGVVYTTDPFGAERGPAVIRQWPAALQEIVRFSADDSMWFLNRIGRGEELFDIILVDGNHEYESASFDLSAAAKIMRPGGVIIMDNAEQTGPFEASRQFLAENPEWRELGTCIADFDPSNPFALPRSSIPETSFIVLQAPTAFTIGPKLRAWGDKAVPSAPQSPGFILKLPRQRCSGRLHFQAIYRGFSGDVRTAEELKKHDSITIELNNEAQDIEYQFDKPMISEVYAKFYPHCHHTFEVELFWQADTGSGPLTLAGIPRPK